MIVGAFAVALLLPRRPSLFEMGGFLASLFLALSAWRHVVLFGAFAGPALAAWVTRILAERETAIAARAPALPRLGAKLEEVLGVGGAPGGALALVAFALVAGGAELKEPRDVLAHPAIQARFPVEATEWLRANKVRGPMLNSYQLGGYLGWRLRGQQRVYVDSRLFIFRPIWEEFLHIEDAFPDWKPRLEKRGATWTILAKNSKLAPLLRADAAWRLVYADRLVRIFARRDGPEGSLPEVPEPG